MMEREAYALYDVRTGKRCTFSSYLTAEEAAADLDNLRRRDAEGQLRPDVHDLMPHLGFIKLTPETWGSRPGDIIDGRDSE